MRANPIIEAALDDPEDLADLRRRRFVNRGLVGLALALVLMVLGVVAWKAARHGFATYWLRANQYRVLWDIDRENMTRGGTTSIKAGVNSNLFSFTGDNSNDELKLLPLLHHVESLDLSMAYRLRDADLAALGDLTSLQALNLDRSRHGDWPPDEPRLTDAVMASIRRLVRLRELNLGGHAITDEGLANLAGLDQLQSLDLRGTKVTDAAFEHLKALPGLKSLDLTGTKITGQGLLDFEAARPRVAVLTDPLPVPTPKTTKPPIPKAPR